MIRLAGTLIAFVASFLISCLAAAIFVALDPNVRGLGHPLAQGAFLAAMLYGPLGYAVAYLGVAITARGTWSGPFAYASAYVLLGAIGLALTGNVQNSLAVTILLIATGVQFVFQRAIALIIRPKSASLSTNALRFE